MSHDYSFGERRAFSATTESGSCHCEHIICDLLPGCISVTASTLDLDKKGVDFIAKLRRGAEVFIDHKKRERGCGIYWRDRIPELALETWSVLPFNGRSGKTGWTLDESKLTDYTLHTFAPEDTRQVFLLPFQLLRSAFRQHLGLWRSSYKVARQSSEGGAWYSECIYVPAPEVLQAINEQMCRETETHAGQVSFA